MLIFPQLQTGCLVQRVQRQKRSRVVGIPRPDGRRSLYLDPYGDTVRWKLRFESLSAEEWQALESLFHACQGRYRGFTFIDPLDNMLSQSDALTADVWTSDPYLSVTNSGDDAWGSRTGTRLVNEGQQSAMIHQTVAVSGRLQYTFSLYLRGAGRPSMDLFLSGSGAEQRVTVPVDTEWRRYKITAALGVDSNSCDFGLAIPAGHSVDCCGVQAEAQPAPSAYKRTIRGAVYPETRFDTDALAVEASSPDCFATSLQMTSRIY